MDASQLSWARDTAYNIQTAIADATLPPQEGTKSSTQRIISRSVTARTRDYIENVVEQINMTYECGCYDACAVMIRRLIETLIIEAFEHFQIEAKIKGVDNNFLYLSDLVDKTIAEHNDNTGKWNLSRNTTDALKKIKSKGDLSAHSRRYNAHRSDIDELKDGLRVTTQELVKIAGIQRAK